MFGRIKSEHYHIGSDFVVLILKLVGALAAEFLLDLGNGVEYRGGAYDVDDCESERFADNERRLSVVAILQRECVYCFLLFVECERGY